MVTLDDLVSAHEIESDCILPNGKLTKDKVKILENILERYEAKIRELSSLLRIQTNTTNENKTKLDSINKEYFLLEYNYNSMDKLYVNAVRILADIINTYDCNNCDKDYTTCTNKDCPYLKGYKFLRGKYEIKFK